MVRRILSASAYLGVMVAAATTARVQAQQYYVGTPPHWPIQTVASGTAPEPSNKTMVLDDQGNVYITGQGGVMTGNTDNHISVWKYTRDGLFLWQTVFLDATWPTGYGVAIALDVNPITAVYVAGAGKCTCGTGYDYVVLKLDPQTGAILRSQTYNNYAANGDDIPVDIVVDINRIVFVTGSSLGANTGTDYATICLTYDMLAYNTNWHDVGWGVGVRRYDGGLGMADVPADMDAQSDFGIGAPEASEQIVVVTGVSFGAGVLFDDDIATVGYKVFNGDDAFAPIRYDGGGPDGGTSIDLTIGPVGGPYWFFVTGYSYRNGSFDYATFGYTSVGRSLWGPVFYNGTGNSKDIPRKVLFGQNRDFANLVYVTGQSIGLSGHNEYATIAYHAESGLPAWTMLPDGAIRFARPGVGLDDKAGDLATMTDAANDVYVIGASFNGVDYDYATIRYNSHDPTIAAWVNTAQLIYNGPSGLSDAAGAIRLWAGDTPFYTPWIYVTGRSSTPSGVFNYGSVRYQQCIGSPCPP